MTVTRLQDLQLQLADLFPRLKRVTKALQDAEDAWTDVYNENDPEEMMYRAEYGVVADKLQDALYTIEYLQRPIRRKGVLNLQANGRYELLDENMNHVYEFTSGSPIEVLINEDERPEWLVTRVESSGGKYYLYHSKDTNMQSLTARIR